MISEGDLPRVEGREGDTRESPLVDPRLVGEAKRSMVGVLGMRDEALAVIPLE